MYFSRVSIGKSNTTYIARKRTQRAQEKSTSKSEGKNGGIGIAK
jgi:hypothetical protein